MKMKANGLRKIPRIYLKAIPPFKNKEQNEMLKRTSKA
jgi:hypothetical protein